MSGTRDLAELLNVNVDELARARALVANRLLEPDPAKPAHADPRQDPRHRRKRHPERLSDLSRCEAQPAQLHDRLDPVLFGAIGDPPRGRGTVRQTRLTLAPVTPNPLPRATDADARSRSRRGHGRTLLDDQHTQPPPTAPTERRVTVKLHPVSSLDWGALTAPSFQGDPDEPTCSGTTSRRPELQEVAVQVVEVIRRRVERPVELDRPVDVDPCIAHTLNRRTEVRAGDIEREVHAPEAFPFRIGGVLLEQERAAVQRNA